RDFRPNSLIWGSFQIKGYQIIVDKKKPINYVFRRPIGSDEWLRCLYNFSSLNFIKHLPKKIRTVVQKNG
ncbi:MAG: hypothetical protein O2V44_08605, partial [Candidatus Bathyarchaeota archaeon]|nr:hypothetical protein [Candidatus Bathyarchaeota archaeon]